MSKRYGRNQKRKAKERINTLELENRRLNMLIEPIENRRPEIISVESSLEHHTTEIMINPTPIICAIRHNPMEIMQIRDKDLYARTVSVRVAANLQHEIIEVLVPTIKMIVDAMEVV
ncbi:MAG: hypothetical protein PQJ59_16595 [Spirochaetales bacterium]|nr:hypothetical protein [Spirochaetales bacterium]